MEEPARVTRIEPRWPAALAIVAVLFLVAVLPERIRLFPIWFPYVVGIAMLVPMTALARHERSTPRSEQL